MAEEERTTAAPPLALVIDASQKFDTRKNASFERALHSGAADEIMEDVIRVLSLLEAYAYLDHERPLIDPHAVSAAATLLVEKLRRAQQHLRGES
jgi:hypothetical protein